MLVDIFERSVQDPCCVFEDDIRMHLDKDGDVVDEDEEEEVNDGYELRKYNSFPVIQQSSQISLQQSQLQLQYSRRNSRHMESWYSCCNHMNDRKDNSHSSGRSNTNPGPSMRGRSRSAKNSICYTNSGRSIDQPQPRSRSQSVVAIPSHLLSIEKYITSELDTNIVPKLQNKKPLLTSVSSSGSSSSEFARPPPKRRTSSFKLSLASSFSP